MTHLHINKNKTEQAWNTLYNRLEEEGLLNETIHPQHTFRQTLVKWAAAIIVACLSLASIYYFTRQDLPGMSTLAVQNNETATTLVTSLEDGSIVFLADNAKLEYPEHFAADKRKVSLQGNALFEVSGDPGHPFLIETGKVQIEVLGTSFHVRNVGQVPFELAVQHGKVKVTLKANGEVQYVSAGETVRLQSSNLNVFPTTDTEQFTRYIHKVQFKDVALSDILRVVNQKDTGMELATTPALADRRLTVSFYDDSPEAIAELLCTAYNLTCSQQEGRLLISEP